MGQYEYSVGLSPALPKDIPAVADAYRAGQSSERNRILEIIRSKSINGSINEALFVLEREINNES